MKTEITIQASKELSEALELVVKLVSTAKEAFKDGVDTTDFVKIVMPIVSDLPAALAGLDQLDDEWKEDPKAFMNAAIMAGASLISALVKK